MQPIKLKDFVFHGRSLAEAIGAATLSNSAVMVIGTVQTDEMNATVALAKKTSSPVPAVVCATLWLIVAITKIIVQMARMRRTVSFANLVIFIARTTVVCLRAGCAMRRMTVAMAVMKKTVL